MQHLKFDSAWEKTISSQDRKTIEEDFQKAITSKDIKAFTPIWQAYNYKGDLLITVIIHNTSNHPLSFQEQIIRYIEGNQLIAEYSFTLPRHIDANTSMPWTFIFPAHCLSSDTLTFDGYLECID